MYAHKIYTAAKATTGSARAQPLSGRMVAQGRRAYVVPHSLPNQDTPVTSTSGSYAVIDMGGYQHWVEEGAVLAADKHVLEEIALGNTVQFKKVLALKEDGSLNFGKPYLSDVCVEGILEEEFTGPSCTLLNTMDDDSGSEEGQIASRSFSEELTLRRLRITKIRSGSA